MAYKSKKRINLIKEKKKIHSKSLSSSKLNENASLKKKHLINKTNSDCTVHSSSHEESRLHCLDFLNALSTENIESRCFEFDQIAQQEIESVFNEINVKTHFAVNDVGRHDDKLLITYERLKVNQFLASNMSAGNIDKRFLTNYHNRFKQCFDRIWTDSPYTEKSSNTAYEKMLRSLQLQSKPLVVKDEMIESSSDLNQQHLEFDQQIDLIIQFSYHINIPMFAYPEFKSIEHNPLDLNICEFREFISTHKRKVNDFNQIENSHDFWINEALLKSNKINGKRMKNLTSDSSYDAKQQSSLDIIRLSRKEKSLSLLCIRFITLCERRELKNASCSFNYAIHLDQAAVYLCTPRRRIYDIVNVLESIEVLSRKAKNVYTWNGFDNLSLTLSKLRALAYGSGFHLYSAKIKEGLVHLAKKELNVSRTEKTLGIMAQKFLMLFLISDNAIVDIVYAAKVLLGDCFNEVTECGKYKTKVRRLYDIANIFMTTRMISKVSDPNYKGLKPAYRYIGPPFYKMSEQELLKDIYKPDSKTKHSLFDQIQKRFKRSKTLPSFDADTGILKFRASKVDQKIKFENKLKIDDLPELINFANNNSNNNHYSSENLFNRQPEELNEILEDLWKPGCYDDFSIDALNNESNIECSDYMTLSTTTQQMESISMSPVPLYNSPDKQFSIDSINSQESTIPSMFKNDCHFFDGRNCQDRKKDNYVLL